MGEAEGLESTVKLEHSESECIFVAAVCVGPCGWINSLPTCGGMAVDHEVAASPGRIIEQVHDLRLPVSRSCGTCMLARTCRCNISLFHTYIDSGTIVSHVLIISKRSGSIGSHSVNFPWVQHLCRVNYLRESPVEDACVCLSVL